MKAALFVCGMEGHSPTEFGDCCDARLVENDFEVQVFDTLEPLSYSVALSA